MRVPFGVALVAVVACGGSGGSVKGPTFAKGAVVRISDGGQIFDALNTTACIKWPSADAKKRGGRDAWRGFHPDTGNEGKVLAAVGHCDGHTQVVLVEVGSYIVPVTSKGVELATAEKPATVSGAATGSEGGYGGYGYGSGSGSYSIGDTVQIADTGGIYTGINRVDCLMWPSEDAKQRGGVDSWGSYYPTGGETGYVIGISAHCDSGIEILILDINGYIVPIAAESVTPY